VARWIGKLAGFEFSSTRTAIPGLTFHNSRSEWNGIFVVIPAKAGIHVAALCRLDSGLRRNDGSFEGS
ncbi:MAG: hypothetical protein KJS83_03475, partial [Xanthomonadaceae bacterium]|nr:hypothetical protein [Xanthomonadaceae bacterium]